MLLEACLRFKFNSNTAIDVEILVQTGKLCRHASHGIAGTV